jgi:methyltransferase (TIGR00027 family)
MNADRPSATALIVAAGLTALAHDRQLGHFVTPTAATVGARAISASPGPLRWLLPQITRPSFRMALGAVEQAILPGILLHYALRKRAIEDAVRQGIATGIGQVIVLGGGFDTLALRLAHEFPALVSIEVDHPATQRVKRQVLTVEDKSPANLTLLPADLAQVSLANLLQGCPAYDPTQATFFVAEGLLMYFPADAVSAIFHAIRAISAPGSRFAFTTMQPRPDQTIGFLGASPLLDHWLRWRGEPFRWALSRTALPAYLSAHGFTPEAVITTAALRRRYLASPAIAHHPLAVGEYLCLARTTPRETAS